ncbi:MAG: glutathione S-transferase family protein [Gammaproteobacteria bacterium]|nr:glutathione S-transferase family protein [Gammaproteobacteria bacterium]MCP5424344.1 glutathione S-transferase family protein [Gammaproteobacteria bacterium]MCP5459098.1 glutathione S-transferase family protein [Gammaproteobacteria bacterium]
MSSLTLVIGNKNYSSWSLRPWLFMKQAGLTFEEVRIPLFTGTMEEQIARYSPAGRVPVLLDGDLHIWESLAICEYLAEQFPEIQGWPQDPAARALARAIACEMHAGFTALRSELPMNCRARRKIQPSPAAEADIGRIIAIWQTCRKQHGRGGPWLFGAFTIADAMFAPVASRFTTYGVDLPVGAQDFVKAVNAHPAYGEWLEAARTEAEVIEEEEVGTPV